MFFSILCYYIIVKYLIPFHKHPRRNLPKHISNKRTESDFVLAFGRTYYQELTDQMSEPCQSFEIARELQIPGLGIADIVSVFTKSNNTILHAFEMKLKDWRKALAQAYRYKYYADVSIVVMPPGEVIKAKQSLSLFHAINVGLWTFDAERKVIERIYHPEKEKPISITAYNKALTILTRQLKSLPVS